jgi:hypothetical protein
MEEEEPTNILDIVAAMLHHEGHFLSSIRFFPGNERSQIMQRQQVNTSSMISLIRLLATTTTRLTINIPLNEADFNEPVIVVPTATHIAAGTTAGVVQTDATCAICQDTIDRATIINHCGHKFHDTCISSWFTRSVRCPVCRWDIRS